MTRILAFDISASPGVAVIEIKTPKRGKPKPVLVMSDSIKTDTDSTDAQRYAYVEAFAIKTIHEHGPFDVIVREHFVKGRSKRGTQLVFGSWSKIDTALQMYGYITENEITPTEVKKLIGGNGKAPKSRKEAEELFRKGKAKAVQFSVEDGVRRICGLGDDYVFKSDDASDAAAIGLAYAIREGLIEV